MIVDLFAGPGGWSEGLCSLGLFDVGIEWDDAACRTRAAAGHLTIRADVGQYPASVFAGNVEGLIASPPCQSFSTAGSKKARGDSAKLRAFAIQSHRGWVKPDSDFADPRTALVLEPLRWVHATRPRWVALEQVPTVLPLWQAMACSFGSLGYSVWTGTVNAADYGIPQTRRRAVLLASLDREARVPVRTHADRWVSMADAVGWTGHVNTGRNWKKGGVRADAQKVECDQPAPTVTGMSGSQWHVVHESGDHTNASLADLAALQTFPAGYPFVGTASSVALQIGNAVPPRLAAVLVGAVSDRTAVATHHIERDLDDDCACHDLRHHASCADCTSGNCNKCGGVGYLPDLTGEDCAACNGTGWVAA